MIKLVLAFLILMLLCAGCRTYVGSDDIIETKSPKVIESKSGSELSRGMILEVEDGKYILTFAERSITRQREKTEAYYCGRRYYYLDKERDNLILNTHKGLGYVLFPLFLPFQWLYDARPFACFNWHLRGDHSPGIGYCIAYLPIVHLLFTPVLRPPYAYDKVRHLEEEDRISPRLVRVTMRDRLIPVFATDSTSGEILISYGDKTISKALSYDGKVEFGINNFANVSYDDNPVEFTVVHRQWGKRWIIRSSPLVDPEELRDWNILANAKYDRMSRIRALMRLERVLGERCCREYLRKLQNDEVNIKPIVRVETSIREDTPDARKKINN